MKRIFTLLSIISISIGANSQVLPNGDFEDVQSVTRNYPAPQDALTFTYDSVGGGWLSGNEINKDIPLIGAGPFLKDTNWAHSGSHAMVLRTQELNNILATGNLGLGEYAFDNVNPFNSIKVGMPFSDKPESLDGYYDYMSVAGDSCWISVFFSKWNSTTNMRDTIGYGEFVTDQNTNSTYTAFSAPITYSSTETPDTMGILVVSSKGGYEVFPPVGQVGSTLVVDNFSFNYDTSTLPEEKQDNIVVKTKISGLEVETPENVELFIFDLSGKLVSKQSLSSGNNVIDIEKSNKTYLFFFNGEKIQSTKKILF